MEYNLEDIDNLVLSGTSRLDSTGEYDITYYENYINENIRIIKDLMDAFNRVYAQLTDEKVKYIVLTEAKKHLIKPYNINRNKQPRVECERTVSSGVGYFQTHKYASFISNDFPRLAETYSEIIMLMNIIYSRVKWAKRKGNPDYVKLSILFLAIKKACTELGIYSPDAKTIRDYIMSIPKDEIIDLGDEFNFGYEIDETNSLSQDIVIADGLPYAVTAPFFTYKGPDKYEFSVNSKIFKPKIWYNESYFNQHRY